MEKKFKHIMVDIETMGNKSFSAINSIAAIKFDIETGLLGEMFNMNVKLKSSLDAGLIVNPDTIMWWLQQNQKARETLVYGDALGYSLDCVLYEFTKFCDPYNYYMWGNSASFDLGILENAYDKCSKERPWEFRNERCLRTLNALAPQYKENTKFEGTEHDPLDDCKHQIKYLTKIWNDFKNIRKSVTLREGKTITNQKSITTPKPKIKPAPQSKSVTTPTEERG